MPILAQQSLPIYYFQAFEDGTKVRVELRPGSVQRRYRLVLPWTTQLFEIQELSRTKAHFHPKWADPRVYNHTNSHQMPGESNCYHLTQKCILETVSKIIGEIVSDDLGGQNAIQVRS